MAFPKRLLAPGEDLVMDLRPHWIALVYPTAVTVVTGVAAGLVIAYLPSGWSTAIRWGVVVVAAAVVLVVAGPRFVGWATAHFVVTTDRVIHRSGLIAKRSMEIPLRNISDVKFHQGVIERVIGAGDLTLESPGEFGQEVFGHIREPELVQKTIYEMTERTRQRMSPAAPAAPSSVAEELAKLDGLRQRGVLSEEEFAAQKARLLGG